MVLETSEIVKDYRVLRDIIEQYFPLNEIIPEYNGLSQNTANVFCVFHPNHSSPSGKLYWDDEKEILTLHCFKERRTFTSYDYVNIILCQRKNEYSDPLDFLVHNMPENELRESLRLAKDKMELLSESAFEKKIEYIQNLYNELDDVNNFIDELYSA